MTNGAFIVDVLLILGEERYRQHTSVYSMKIRNGK